MSKTEENTSKTNDNIGLILSTHYEIINICLNNLPNTDLHKAAPVCKSWNHVIKDIRKKRTKLQFHLLVNKNVFTKQNCHNLEYIKKAMQGIKGLAPRFCIAFASAKLHRSYCYKSRDATPKMQKELQDSLPVDCPSILAVADGIIYTDYGFNFVTPSCSSIEAVEAVTFPDIPGVSMQLFRRDSDRFGLSQFLIHQDGKAPRWPPHAPLMLTFMWQYTSGPANWQPVKCALLFSTGDNSAPSNLHAYLKNKQKEPFAYGGCVVNTMRGRGMADCPVTGAGVFFSGSNLSAASIVIQPEDESELDIEAKMLQMKECKFSLTHSLAFMFSCTGRPNTEMETRIFHRVFPETQVLGVVGNGEIGLNYLPKPGEEQPVSASLPKRRSVSVDHSFSTVIVLLSWK